MTLKYVEPQDSALPEGRWRFHVFKGDKQIGTTTWSYSVVILNFIVRLDVVKLYGKKYFVFGRDPSVHPSISLHMQQTCA